MSNSNDQCPADGNKTVPGQCGCGVPDTDSDGDGTADCNDDCPNDPNKVAPGACGCGVADVATMWYADADGDGLGDPNVAQAGFTCHQPQGYVSNNTDACPAVRGTIGSACDDNDLSTINDVLNANCVCVGSPADCDDHDPCTVDSFNGTECVHTALPDIDQDGTCDLTDGCPNDPNKIAPGVCGCGVADIATMWYADADGDGLGDPNVAQAGFTCHQPPGYVSNNTDACPAVRGTIGSTCDDNDPRTINDLINEDCVCIGTQVTQCDNWTLTITTDNAGSETTWSITDASTSSVIATGGPYADNVTVVETICMPADPNCYILTVNDAGGNGIAGGGYVLRDANGNRAIDNSNNGGNFTNTSRSPEGFCSPIGRDQLAYTFRDNLQLLPTDVIWAMTNSAVYAQWQVGDQNLSGYEFWFTDPNGGYSRRLFHSHAMAGGWPANATRATRLGLASWSTMPLPANKLLNVRVRSRVNGTNAAWGPACRLKVDVAAAACPVSKLGSNPDLLVNCGAEDLQRRGSILTADPVMQYVNGGFHRATNYCFRFENLADHRVFELISPTYNLVTAPQMPFQYGARYSVTVRMSFDGGATYCPFGPACTIGFFPPSSGGQAQRNLMIEDATTTGASLSLWPNPNNEGLVNISMNGLPEGDASVTIDVFNAVGQRIYGERTTKSGTRLDHMLNVQGTLPAGLYLVNVTIGERTFISRLVME
ncbi:MAG: T9SS type A sorting domain-containing protein [Flavobacteriales bacterium]